METKNIKKNITTDNNHCGNATGNPMDEDRLNETVCCNVGDTLVSGQQENKVAEIAFLGNMYSLEVRIENGQKISMRQLNDLVNTGQIIIKQ